MDFCAPMVLRTHLLDIIGPTVFTIAALFTMIGMGCLQPSFHNSHSIATHPIPNAPITSDEVFVAAGYHQYFLAICPLMWMTLQPLATTDLPLRWMETVYVQARGDGGGRYQTKATTLANWLSYILEHNFMAHLGERILELDGLDSLCPKLIHR